MTGYMSTDEARGIERDPIEVGDHAIFYSTLYDVDGNGILVRQFTGQEVIVISVVPDEDMEDTEPMFMVRADDGTEFGAWEGELNGWFFDTGQFYSPDGEWGLWKGENQ